METIQDRLDALTHKLLHQRQGLVGIRAEDVAGGTFGNGVGNYAFPVNVTIAGTLGVTGAATFAGVTATSLQVPWIELRNTGGNAAIDFTRTPGSLDFNVRVENDASGYITFGSYSTTGVRATIRGELWKVGQYEWDNAWAHFGHRAKMDVDSASYAFMHADAGSIRVNVAANEGILQYRANNRLWWDTSQVYVGYVPLTIAGQPIYTKSWNDGTHRIQHSSGLDSLEFFTWSQHRFITAGALRTVIDGDVNNFGGLFKGTWGGNAPGLKSRSGGNVCQLQWWSTFEMWVDATLVKTFVIDHPAKSDRYLVHAAVEGPEVVVVYRGQAALEKGWVEVRLPDYFEALTKLEGRSVHLTSIADDPEDEWCPVLHATYPKNGRFFVGLGSGLVIEDQRFWWEVKAVRKDVSINVEPLKKDVVVMGTGPYSYYREKT